MLVDETNIPPGLENAFNAIVQFDSAIEQSKLNNHRISPARRLYYRVSDRSLLKLWAPLYNGFDETRRASWDVYWGSWPGSGFSAFVQVNAPLYRAGLPLMYDPP